MSDSPRPIGSLLVIGVGLIGGSLALALKRAGAVGRVTGFGRNRQNLEKARALGVIDGIAGSLAEGVAGADVVFLGTPVGAMPALLGTIAPHLGAGTLVTDGGSTKSGLVDSARERLGDAFPRFVAGHPIAGSERSGVEAASASLYDDHHVLLTPVAETDPYALERVRDMWLATGARVQCMDAAEHDRILGRTSHLPHLLAFALVDYIARGEDAARCFELAAGGFFDFTRIASSDPVMWRDISIANRDALAAALDEYIAALGQARELVAGGDGAALEALFSFARESRNRVLDRRRGGNS